jgi:hypothetical protein
LEDMKDYLKKRKYPRRRYVKPLGLLVHGHYSMARSEEIGEGGLLLSSPQTVKVGETVILSIILPLNEIAIAKSTVRYVKKTKSDEMDTYPFQIGIQFDALPFRFKKKVRDYIAAKSEEEAMTELDGYERLTEITKE